MGMSEATNVVITHAVFSGDSSFPTGGFVPQGFPPWVFGASPSTKCVLPATIVKYWLNVGRTFGELTISH